MTDGSRAIVVSATPSSRTGRTGDDDPDTADASATTDDEATAHEPTHHQANCGCGTRPTKATQQRSRNGEHVCCDNKWQSMAARVRSAL